jgi:hypothetical protein
MKGPSSSSSWRVGGCKHENSLAKKVELIRPTKRGGYAHSGGPSIAFLLVFYVPVPAKAAASGLPAPLSFTKTLALRAPVFFGLNVTVTLQDAPGASS